MFSSRKREITLPPSDPGNANVSAVFDIIILIGKDNPGRKDHQKCIPKLKMACEKYHLRYLIVGDGETDIDDAALKELPESNNLVFYGHGHKRDNRHMITMTEESFTNGSMNFIAKVQSVTKSKCVAVITCYGAAIINEFKKNPQVRLLNGSMLVAPSSPDEVSFASKNIRVIRGFIKRINPGKFATMTNLITGLIKVIPETIGFAVQPDDPDTSLQSIILSRNAREIYLDIEKYCQYQLDRFGEFIDTVMSNTPASLLSNELESQFPWEYASYLSNLNSENKIKLFSLDMSADEIGKYRDYSLWNHAFHHDNRILEKLLGMESISGILLPMAIIASSRHPKWTCYANLIRVLFLQNHQIIMYGQTINHLAPDASLSDYLSLVYKFGLKGLVPLVYTPLTLALEYGASEDVVAVLLECGADIYQADSFGRVPIYKLVDEKYKAALNASHPEFMLLKEIRDFIRLLSNSSDNIVAWYFSLKDAFSIQFVELVNKYVYLKDMCQARHEVEFFAGIRPIPHDREVFEAYKDLMKTYKKTGSPTTFKFDSKRVWRGKSKLDLLDELIKFCHEFLNIIDARVIEEHQLLKMAIESAGYNQQKCAGAVRGNVLDLLVACNQFKRSVKALHPQILIAIVKAHDPDKVDIILAKACKLLELAVKAGDEYIVNALVSSGVDCNLKTSDYSYLPLYYAVVKGRIDIIQSLLNGGAIVGRNTLSAAISSDRLDVLELLLSQPVSLVAKQYALRSLCSKHYDNKHIKEMVDLLIKNGADLNDVGSSRMTVFSNFLADVEFEGRHVCFFRYLIDKGADINFRDGENGYTELHCAVMRGNIVLVQALLDEGADMKLTDEEGKTALDYAETSSSIRKILLNATLFPESISYMLQPLLDFIEDTRQEIAFSPTINQEIFMVLNEMKKYLEVKINRYAEIDLDDVYVGLSKYMLKLNEFLTNYKIETLLASEYGLAKTDVRKRETLSMEERAGHDLIYQRERLKMKLNLKISSFPEISFASLFSQEQKNYFSYLLSTLDNENVAVSPPNFANENAELNYFYNKVNNYVQEKNQFEQLNKDKEPGLSK